MKEIEINRLGLYTKNRKVGITWGSPHPPKASGTFDICIGGAPKKYPYRCHLVLAISHCIKPKMLTQ